MDINALLHELTLEEKARLCMGADSWQTWPVERLSIPSVRTSDGPHGLRRKELQEKGDVGVNDSEPATCFPPAALTSCSFNRELFRRMGQAIAQEAIEQDIDVVLGPAVNIKRSPLCGRNFEYVSEDPYLAGEYAVGYIDGMQGEGVGTSLKHYAVNSQETLRMNIDAAVDERALREIYLYAFERAVKKSQPFTVMASYNRINGDYGCENSHTLRDLLRNEWGFKGLVMSDWSAINDRVKALGAGCDLEMPHSGKERTQEIIDAVKSGRLSEETLDEAVAHVLQLVERCNVSGKTKTPDVYEKNHKLAEQIAAESMVLLKNQKNMLPLKQHKNYAVIGAFAQAPRYQGGGSSHITPTKLVSFNQVCKEQNLPFTYSPGYDLYSDGVNHKMIDEAAAAAAKADIAIVFVGLTDIYEYEGLDRQTLKIPPDHLELLSAVQKANENIVVVLCAGSAVEMDWEKQCRAILYAGVMGQAGGKAIFDLLFGKETPSGKLTETFPLTLSDTPCYHCFPGGNNSVHYLESIYVGYRYYLTARVPVRYPFGFGLSYTEFYYSDFKADSAEIAEGQSLNLSLRVKNTGAYNGAEAVQIYVKNCTQNTFTPVLQLKDFQKVFLHTDEERGLSLSLPYEAFTRYDSKDGWVADSGRYEIYAAGSSTDLRQMVTVSVQGKGRTDNNKSLCYYTLNSNTFGKADFEKLYGRPLPPPDVDSMKPYTLNTPLGFCAHTFMGRVLFWVGKREVSRANPGPSGYAARRALIGSLGYNPIRSLVIMQEGRLNLASGEGIVKMLNGRLIAGLKELLHSLKDG